MGNECTSQNPFGLKVGDMAIIESGEEADNEGLYAPGWVSDMNYYVGQAHKISCIFEETCHFEGVGWTFDLRYVTPYDQSAYDFEIDEAEFEDKINSLFE